jgi:predicted amidophosphoribosyltransferase
MLRKILASVILGAVLMFGAASCQVFALVGLIATDFPKDTTECPYCHEQIPENEFSCPNCGAHLK